MVRLAEQPQAKDAGNGGEPFKRWTAKRKAAVVLDLIQGETTPAAIARQHDVTIGDVERWVETFTQAGEEALRSHPRERDEQHEAEKDRLHAKIGERTLELDAEKKRCRGLAGLWGRDLVIAVRNDLLAEGKDVSLVWLCRWLGVARSTVYYVLRQRPTRPVDGILANLIDSIIRAFPTFGIRRVWTYLNYRLAWAVNLKKVARIMRHFGWCVHKRRQGGRPRVPGGRSVTERLDQCWVTDVASVFCGAADGWCSFVPVVDYCTRQVLG